MLHNKQDQSLPPKRILFRLTIINIIVIASFIVLSSFAIYNTACMLADGMITVNKQRQDQFESTLLQYLWIFSLSAILIGSLIHFYLTKKMIDPLRDLIKSTKRMKQGKYPEPLHVKSEDEMGQLIGHFNDLVQQLKDNEHHRQKLVANLSHEFRTPLSNLSGYLNAMNKGVIHGDQKLYQSLYGESKRLIHLVEQMEQLKEWDYVSNQTFSEKEAVMMLTLVEQSVEMFRWTLDQAKVQLDVQVQSGIVHVYNGGISQVISNLLDNAIRYYKGSGPITIRGENDESHYTLSITGPGQMIPVAEQEEIFERFYRTDQSRSRDLGGTGLGLAISKEIVERHNGTIGVESDRGLHTFWFTLPLSGCDSNLKKK